MSEEQLEPVVEEVAPPRNVTEWAAYQHFQEINTLLRDLTPMNWTAHADPEREGTYYIGGPPDTEIIAENLTKENAESIVKIINDLPEAVEYFEDLSKLWDAAMDMGTTAEPANTSDIFSTIMEVVNRYQLRIAQAEANPAPVPAATIAGELNYMHIGHLLTFESAGVESLPLTGIFPAGDEYVRVVLARPDADQHIILPLEAPVEVTLVGMMTDLVLGEAVEEVPSAEDPSPVVDPE